MDEQALRQQIDHVKAGRVSRRSFIRTMAELGVTARLAAQVLASAGVRPAQAQTSTFTPTKRGGGGALKMLWWQAPTLLNPHFATGTKDQEASRIFYEPLAGYDPDGTVVPLLARHRTDATRHARALVAAGPLGEWMIEWSPRLACRAC